MKTDSNSSCQSLADWISVQSVLLSLTAWYLCRLLAVNAIALAMGPALAGFAAEATPIRRDPQESLQERFECTRELALRFAPPAIVSPTALSSQVCASPAPMFEILPAGWSVEAPAAAEVFVAADPRVKRMVALLYGGQRPMVARGWIAREDQLESVTLISPHPDRSLTRLVPGTLLIRIVTSR